MTSSYPSPFTSPAEATDWPKLAPAWIPVEVQSGKVLGRPAARPGRPTRPAATVTPSQRVQTVPSIGVPLPRSGTCRVGDCPLDRGEMSRRGSEVQTVGSGRLRADPGVDPVLHLA